MIDIILHVIIGLLLGYFFAQVVITPTYHVGPNSTKIRSETHKDNQGCYRLKPVIHICPMNASPSKH